MNNIDAIYRPWGELSWLTSRLEHREYHFYGCLSTESRCLESLKILKSKNILSSVTFLEIIDPVDSQTHISLRSKHKFEIDQIFTVSTLEQHKLLCPINDVFTSISTFLDSCNGNIILDISSFPKRFFFPIVKVLLNNELAKNLIVTYSTPLHYSSSSLSENPMDWAHIPMFDNDDPDKDYDKAIIGLGFMPLGLPNLLRDRFSDLTSYLIFPFPPGSPFFQRTWKFIESMQIEPKIDHKNIIRIDASNVSENFDSIKIIADGNSVLMAPYGPKPISLAMCLYACLTNSPVYYTQPTTYDASYSYGVSMCAGYSIKLGGQNLYEK